MNIKNEFFTIARPYAKAVFDFAIETNTLDSWQKILECFSEIVSHKKIKKLLNSKSSSLTAINIFNHICGDILNNNESNLIQIMSRYHRLEIFPHILKYFLQLRAIHERTYEVDVISSNVLDDMQISKIKRFLESKLSGEVKVHVKIDKNIILGLVICANNIVIEASIRNRLDRLKNILKY